MTTGPCCNQLHVRGLSAGHFRCIGERGLGDGNNAYAHSCAWFDEHLYIGLTRCTLPLLAIKRRQTISLDPFPVPKLEMQEMDLRGQIWRYSPARKVWELAFRAPLVESCEDEQQRVPLAVSFRNMGVFHGKSDPGPTLYTVPTQGLRPARRVMLRSCDGRHFEEIPQPILPGEYGKWRSFRELIPFKGRLFTSPAATQDNFASAMSDRPDKYQALGRAANIASGASVRCTEDPLSGRWEESSAPGLGDPTNCSIFDMAACGDYLYVGTLNVREGFQLWRTDGEGPCPHRWEKVLDRGADRGPSNQLVQSFAEFRGDLYLGTAIQNGGYDKVNNIGPAGGEIIRVHPDGTWDLVVGEPRRTRQGFKVPTSGLGPGFGMLLNGYIWRMAVHDDVLYAGTAKLIAMFPYTDRSKWPAFVRGVLDPRALERLLEKRGGAELWRSCDGDNWTPVTVNGFDNRYNTGVRSLLSTPEGLFVGTANLYGPKIALRHPGGWRYEDNPKGGLEVWHGSYEHDGRAEAGSGGLGTRSGTQDLTVGEPGGAHGESSGGMDLTDLELLGDELLDTAASIDAMTRALCDTELFDPLKRMALVDMDLEVLGDSVDDDVNQYFQGAEVRNVGYWCEGVRTPKQAACGLLHELASMAFDRKQEGPAVSALVVGPNADGIAVELLRLREDARVTVLVFDTASAQRAQVCEPRAKVVRSRWRKFKLADATFDVVLWVEGPGWPERVSSLREIHRVLKPGGVLAAADLLVRQTEPDLNPDEAVDAIAAYERALRGAGLVDVEVLDVTDKTWRPFFEHSRRYFRVKHLFDEIHRDRYQQTFEALPGGNQPVVAYVMILASRGANR